nr:metalloprotease PmbA [Pleionea sp. CnH1-48]
MDVVDKNHQMRNICERILELSKKHGATSAEVGVSQDAGLSIQVRDADVETVEFNQDSSFGITVFFDQSKGSATTTDTSDEAIEAAVAAACNIARYTSPDPYAGLADAALMAKDIHDLQLDHPTTKTVDDLIHLAKDCEAAGLAYDSSIRQSDGASVSSHRFIRVYANSHGFVGDSVSTRHSLSCMMIAEDAKGMQRDFWYTISRDFDKLQSAAAVGRKAAEKVVGRLGGRAVDTCKVPVLFAPDTARGLLGHFFGAIRGAALYRRSSFLVDTLGQPIFPKGIVIDERPHEIGGLSSASFDNEGVATFARNIVEDGILQGYILGSYSARKLGMTTTANAGGLHNTYINDTGHSFEDLLKMMGTGLLVTEVMGQGVNLVSGDYSRGASGFWVENGEIQHPVQEITIAGNLRDMFANVAAVGNDKDHRSSIVTGSILVEGMTLAGS